VVDGKRLQSGSVVRIAAMIAATDDPANAGRPVSIS
jgi:hypothetical protein